MQQLIDVERAADGKGRSIHDFPMAFCLRRSLIGRYFCCRYFCCPVVRFLQQLLFDIDSPNNLRRFVVLVLNNIDIVVLWTEGAKRDPKQHQLPANLDPITDGKQVLIDTLSVHKRSVATVQVSQKVLSVEIFDLGMNAGSLRVIKMNFAVIVSTNFLIGFSDQVMGANTGTSNDIQ